MLTVRASEGKALLSYGTPPARQWSARGVHANKKVQAVHDVHMRLATVLQHMTLRPLRGANLTPLPRDQSNRVGGRPRDGADVNALDLLKGQRAPLPFKPANSKQPVSVPAGEHSILDYGVKKSYVTSTGNLIPMGKELFGPPQKKYKCDVCSSLVLNHGHAYVEHL